MTFISTALAAVIAKQFFAGLDPTSAYIFALLAFAAFARPFGALVFGRLGDMTGRQYTFPGDHPDHGLATKSWACLPNYNSIGVAAQSS